MKNFAIRTVKNGRVKIGGVYYVPTNPDYDDALEGLRYAFGRYWTGDKLYRNKDGKSIVCLWGTEHDYKTGEDRDFSAPPHCGVDGSYIYEWWSEVD